MKEEEIAQLFSAQTACMFAVIEWIIASQHDDRSLLIQRLYELQAEAYRSEKILSAKSISHLIYVLEAEQGGK